MAGRAGGRGHFTFALYSDYIEIHFKAFQIQFNFNIMCSGSGSDFDSDNVTGAGGLVVAVDGVVCVCVREIEHI